ncbi:hypothetical protein SAMN05216203_1609 [Marinobacter daqiaonensis]|uniref:Transglutaminase-like superfamily protein n=1 Tax=Marinobacter daqiaonensis TaxID=650891 RepID=A0A1I6HWC0_9GAMM|nr:hypothetical protein [Marinobacter daqiaonensis]SFR58762.1 hypothetical protein SAMN05216203_1609 [Marinobacter daqiaonensis]
MNHSATSRRGARNRFLLLAALLCLAVGIVLMGINLYGLTQPLRKPGLGVTDRDQLRFVTEEVWSYQQSLDAIDRLAGIEPLTQRAEAANKVVNQSLVHVKWNRVDPEEYRQLVPIWENYFLWAIGRFSGLPQFERYHYADYRRNIRRGIGICGDASTILSSVMDRYGIPNRIVSFHGHVIVEFEDSDGRRNLLDPDFGVGLGIPLESLLEDPKQVRDRYLAAGYSERETDTLLSIYKTDHAIFDDTYHFMSKRYVFEHASYVAKWLVPVALIVLPLIWLARTRRTTSH